MLILIGVKPPPKNLYLATTRAVIFMRNEAKLRYYKIFMLNINNNFSMFYYLFLILTLGYVGWVKVRNNPYYLDRG